MARNSLSYLLYIVYELFNAVLVVCLCTGIHPTTISDSFQKAAAKSAAILEGMSTAVQLTDRESLLQSATTSLSSKVRKNHAASKMT